MSRLSLAFKALRELGPWQIGQFALYRLALQTGWLRRATLRAPGTSTFLRADSLRPLLAMPDSQRLQEVISVECLPALWEQAGEILEGRVRLFGGEPTPLQLSIPGPLAHWTAYETGLNLPGVEDIKFVWEPGRFGWAYTLGRAYWLSGEERYSQAFWKFTETFWDANPAYQGPHWSSAQEVALRLMALVFAAQVFATSQQATPERLVRLAQSVAEHATRIPVSLAYARAQNNNHLLSEAAGLYTAGLALPDHPHAQRWKDLGWKWFNRGLQSQIDADGGYMQHSTNYHRLVLQLGLWIDSLSGEQGRHLPEASRSQLAKATRWLFRLLDRTSGQVPNLGPNDGAYILPLTVQPFEDFRPILQAAGQAFLGEALLEPGPWDEMALWLPGNPLPAKPDEPARNPQAEWPEKPARLELPSGDSWAYLRAASFRDRPGHADQLHLDLWWRGLNLAQDAGTYLYNGQSPWDNALARTAAHNTVVLDGQEQMTWAGRFLWLDWSHGTILHSEKAPEGFWTSLTASHDGYQRLGCVHRRSVSAGKDEWLIQDELLPVNQPEAAGDGPHTFQLHWLLPDWPWTLKPQADEDQLALQLKSPHGWVNLVVSASRGEIEGASLPQTVQLTLVRAGKCLSGSQIPNPTWGWVSPTYGVKIPALSATYLVVGNLPICLESRWLLPAER